MSWEVEYFDGESLAGNPLAEDTAASINISSKDDLPSAVLKRDGKDENIEHFSARWTRTLNGPGEYRFTFNGDDGLRAFVDGRRFYNQWSFSADDHTRTIKLSPGAHTIVVEFYNAGGPFKADVEYERIAGQSAADVRKAREQVALTGRLTRGGLVAARIYEVDDDGEPIFNSQYGILYCMFNPHSYKVKKASSFVGKGLDENKNYALLGEKTKSKPRELTLKELWFDTSEPPPGRPYEDVSKYTDHLIEFAETVSAKYSTDFREAETAKAPPPKIAFRWGNFRFLGVLTHVKVKFVHFSPDGIPLRAKAGIKLKEFRHRRVYPPQNPTSGTEALERVWQVKVGERLDYIAAEVYADASQWRRLAAHNGITDPLNLRPGQLIKVPPQ